MAVSPCFKSLRFLGAGSVLRATAERSLGKRGGRSFALFLVMRRELRSPFDERPKQAEDAA